MLPADDKRNSAFLGRHIEGFSAGYSRGGIKYRSAEIGVDVDGFFSRENLKKCYVQVKYGNNSIKAIFQIIELCTKKNQQKSLRFVFLPTWAFSNEKLYVA